jgi:tRNA G18 (ribose-2'-O)-methylase SpoU
MKPLIGSDLKRFLRSYKRENLPKRVLVILLQSVEYPYNVGAIFRLADGAGIGEIILTGITPKPPNPTIKKVARGKTKNVKWHYQRDPVSALAVLKDNGYQIIALELTESSVPYDEFEFSQHVCLVVGHEDHGVTKDTLKSCDASVFVPMYGKGRSHNVNTALAIVTYHIIQS